MSRQSQVIRYANGDALTENAILDKKLLSESGITLPTEATKIEINDGGDSGNGRGLKNSDYTYWRKPITVIYPDKSSTTSAVIPDVVIHGKSEKAYGREVILVGILKSWANLMGAKFSSTGHNVSFEDNKVLSDEVYYWFQYPINDRERKNSKFITVNAPGSSEPDAFSDHSEFFSHYNTNLASIVPCIIDAAP